MLSDSEDEIKQQMMISAIRKEEAPRVTQDQIIVENEQTSNTLQSVVCPVCLLVLGLPHWVCEGCDNAFCKQCLENWWKKNPDSCIFRCSHPGFKVVKRSNTYQAIMDILKVRCKYCEFLVSLSSINSHDTSCPKKPVKCPIQECLQYLPREIIGTHANNCPFRRRDCRFCQASFLVSVIQDHEDKQCPDRVVKCPNAGCSMELKYSKFTEHLDNCEFFLLRCEWCELQVLRNSLQEHCQNCQKRQFQCEWCRKGFIRGEIQIHLSRCPLKTFRCELCQTAVKQSDALSHRSECMFKEIIALKASHNRLAEENVHLKVRVHELEIELEDYIKNRHQLTIDSLIKVKEEERKEHEKDLLRIRNSIQSLKKCRNEELAEHQKKLHLSTSLCVICTTLRKKLDDELEPLLKMQDETLLKLKELQRVQYATRKSVIRI